MRSYVRSLYSWFSLLLGYVFLLCFCFLLDAHCSFSTSWFVSLCLGFCIYPVNEDITPFTWFWCRFSLNKQIQIVLHIFIALTFAFFTGYEEKSVENALQLACSHKPESSSLDNNSEEMAMVGLDAMQRANSTLEDFVRRLCSWRYLICII